MFSEISIYNMVNWRNFHFQQLNKSRKIWRFIWSSSWLTSSSAATFISWTSDTNLSAYLLFLIFPCTTTAFFIFEYASISAYFTVFLSSYSISPGCSDEIDFVDNTGVLFSVSIFFFIKIILLRAISFRCYIHTLWLDSWYKKRETKIESHDQKYDFIAIHGFRGEL